MNDRVQHCFTIRKCGDFRPMGSTPESLSACAKGLSQDKVGMNVCRKTSYTFFWKPDESKVQVQRQSMVQVRALDIGTNTTARAPDTCMFEYSMPACNLMNSHRDGNNKSFDPIATPVHRPSSHALSLSYTRPGMVEYLAEKWKAIWKISRSQGV